MTNLPIEIIHRNRFNSHPIADIMRECAITTHGSTYMRTHTSITWMQNISGDFDDEYETKISKYDSKNTHHKISKKSNMFEQLYYHTILIKRIIEPDAILSSVLDGEHSSDDKHN